MSSSCIFSLDTTLPLSSQFLLTPNVIRKKNWKRAEALQRWKKMSLLNPTTRRLETVDGCGCIPSFFGMGRRWHFFSPHGHLSCVEYQTPGKCIFLSAIFSRPTHTRLYVYILYIGTFFYPKWWEGKNRSFKTFFSAPHGKNKEPAAGGWIHGEKDREKNGMNTIIKRTHTI